MALVDTLSLNYWCTEHQYRQRILSNLRRLAHQLAHQTRRPCNHVRPLAMKPHAGSELLPIRLASMALVDTLPSNYWCTDHHYSQRIITNCQPQRRIYFCVPVLVPTFLIGIPHKAGVTKMFYLSFGYYCTAASL
jgi:hypothetical protein